MHHSLLVVGEDIAKQLAPFVWNEALPASDQPQAVMDWWVLGGRWDSFFTTNDGREVSVALKSDIDWETMRHAAREARGEYFDTYRRDDPTTWSHALGHTPEDDESRAAYVARGPGVSTYAVLLDGDWQESDDFVTSDEWVVRWNQLVEELPDDVWLSVIDYHE